MAPRLDVVGKKNRTNSSNNNPPSSTTRTMRSSHATATETSHDGSRTSSQAEAVAAQVAGVHLDDATVASTPPSSPPRTTTTTTTTTTTNAMKRQESALRRLAGRFRARRSLSAPPTLRRRTNRLLEEHFLVESSSADATATSTSTTTRDSTGTTSRSRSTQHPLVVLPGVPKQEDNWARDLHDFFNLVVLVPVVALNGMNWNWDQLWNSDTTPSSSSSTHHHHHHSSTNTMMTYNNFHLGDAWTGEWFDAFFYVTALYFVTDLLWMVVCPHCVRSPSVIIQHHVATLLYIYVPFQVPAARWFMGACMSVEVNTWLLIARRVFNKQGFPPWTIIDLSFFSIRVKLISIFFYITWIGIRCILYPYLLVDIWNQYSLYSLERGSRINLLLVCFPLHAIFCLLNLKWSYDLLMSKIRYWRRCRANKNNNNREAVVMELDSIKDKGL